MQRNPQWQPIEVLPEFYSAICELHSSSIEQLRLMSNVMNNPADIDEVTLSKVVSTYTEHLDDHWILVKQFEIWFEQSNYDAEQIQIEDATRRLTEIKGSNQKILTIAKNIVEIKERSPMNSLE